MIDLAALRRSCLNWGRYFGLGWEEAEDGAQDVTMRAWRKGVLFPEARAMHGFAKTAMRNWIIDQTRKAESKIQGISYDAWNGYTDLSEPSTGALCWLLGQCRDEADRATLAAMAYGYSPTEQVRSWPGLFPTVNDAYNARRNLRGRLVRASLLDLAAPDDLTERSLARR